LGDRLLCLLLGADEQHTAALGDRVLDEVERLLDVVEGLAQVDDVDPVALGEDEALHLRVPPPGLVSEVDAALQELAHGHYGHVRVLLWSPWLSRRAGGPSPWRPVVGRGDTRHRSGPGRPPPPTECRREGARGRPPEVV